MTKAELIEQLKDVGEDEEIGAFWDDCEWEIHGVLSSDPDSDFGILINCC